MIEEVEITLIKFKDSSGVLYHTREEAEIAESILKGDSKICPDCGGSKFISPDPYMGWGGSGSTCDKCDSDGLVWRKEVWV